MRSMVKVINMQHSDIPDACKNQFAFLDKAVEENILEKKTNLTDVFGKTDLHI